MKLVFTLFAYCFVAVAAAQSVSTTVKFDKTEQPALMLYLPYNETVAEGTILSKLKETGFQPQTTGSLFWKNNKVNGFYAFKGVVLKSDTPQLMDMYFKVDRRGSKKDNQSVMYLVTTKGGPVNFVSSTSDTAAYASAQRFLNTFVSETATYKHTLDVTAQEETVKKAEKKLANLLSDEQDLNKKIAKLQEELAKNKSDQVNQQKSIEDERAKLAVMKTVQQ